MFSSKTGWFAVLVSIIGALTAVDVLPFITTFLDGAVGAQAAHVVGSLLTAIGVVVAKLSHPTPTAPNGDPQ